MVSAVLKNKNGLVISSGDSDVSDGIWRVRMPPAEACESCTLTVECSSEKVTFNDVAVGEVWLAGGQSNMEFELGNCTEGPDELNSRQMPNVRYYYTPKNSFFSPKFYEDEKASHWTKWGDESCHAWSAVAYFFAKELAGRLGVTVGIIGCNWGGTSASAWIPRSCLEQDESLKPYLSDYAEKVGDKSEEEQASEFDLYTEKRDAWLKNPVGADPWPGPMGIHNPCRPCGLYDCLVSRLFPYTIKGFLYYQGESDEHRPDSYGRLLTALIMRWRSDWQDLGLPFVIVQLPEHRDAASPDTRSWCIIRQKQQDVWHSVRNTVLVPALGLGEYNDIHPKHKKALGERIYESVMSQVYGTNSFLTPFALSAVRSGDAVTVTIANASNGLKFCSDNLRREHYRDMEALQGNSVIGGFTGMELCGEDGIFYPARSDYESSSYDGTSRMTVRSCCVKKPCAVRYGWYNYGPVTWYGINGLPVLPFFLNV